MAKLIPQLSSYNQINRLFTQDRSPTYYAPNTQGVPTVSGLIPQFSDYDMINQMFTNEYTNDIYNQYPMQSTDPMFNTNLDYVDNPLLGSESDMVNPIAVVPTSNIVTGTAAQSATPSLGSISAFFQKNTPELYNKFSNTFGGADADVAAVKKFGDSMGTAWGGTTGKQKFDTIGSTLKGIYGIYNGQQQLKNAKDTLNFNKQAWQKNYDAQAKMTNSQLADRQARRYYEDSKNTQSVGDYMNKYGVK